MNAVRDTTPASPKQIAEILARGRAAEASRLAECQNVAMFRQALWESGYRPIAVTSPDGTTMGGKRPFDVGWQDLAREPRPYSARTEAFWGVLNTGILCDGLRAIDIDVNDAAKVETILCEAMVYLGVAPTRYRENSPRLLLLYRATEGSPRKRAVTAPDGEKVEVLGYGQQFVAAGLHLSGARIRWRDPDAGAPWTCQLPRRDDLLEVTEDQVSAFLRAAADVIGAPHEGRRATRAITSASSMKTEREPAPDVPLDVLDAIMAALPNGLEYADRGKWIGMAHAVAAAYASDLDRGREVFLAWSERSERDVDAEKDEKAWESIVDEEHTADVRTIFAAARRAGVDLPACGYVEPRTWIVDAQDEFEATEVLPPDWPAPAHRLPELVIRNHNIAATAAELGVLLERSPRLFERVGSGPIAISLDPDGLPIVRAATVERVIHEAHDACTPVAADKEGKLRAVTLPERVAKQWLHVEEVRRLRPFAGIAAAPILDSAGGIRSTAGYDPVTRLLVMKLPEVEVPEAPTRQDAEEALLALREVLAGFPFADAERVSSGVGASRVDLSMPPGLDESAALVGLLSAVARPSLATMPGLLVSAPAINGAGSGKGLLVRVLSAIAFSAAPRAFTAGRTETETESRIVGAILTEAPVLFLDNVNGRAFRSETLMSIMTERDVALRPLGGSLMPGLQPRCFVALAGNGLSVSEDLIRRFVECRLDTGMENAEARVFEPNFLDYVHARRAELLRAALIIWRWGRHRSDLPRGLPLGSFESWAEWVRDPLLALGCRDPVSRMEAAKAEDPRRERSREIMAAWWSVHQAVPVQAGEIGDYLKGLIDPQARGRQFIAHQLKQLVGQRAGGFVFSTPPKSAPTAPQRYAVAWTGEGQPEAVRQPAAHECALVP